MNNYLLVSNDEVAIEDTIFKIVKENNFENALKTSYDMEETFLNNALEDLDTYSFLSPKKIIIIKNIDILKADENKEELDHLYKYIDNPNTDNLLLIVAKKLNNTLKMTKELKKRLTTLNIEVNMADFAKKELAGYTIGNDAIMMLLDYCKDDITKLKNECQKLKDYKFLEKKITKDDIDNLVIIKLGDSKDLTFSFVRSLAEKNKKEALKKYKELLNYNIEPIAIIGLIASQIRIMYQVKILEKKGLSNKSIADKLGEKSDYRIAKTKELTIYYTEEELLKLMIELEKIDLKAKSQDVDCNFLIDMFILNMF